MKRSMVALAVLCAASVIGAIKASADPRSNKDFDAEIADHAKMMLDEGKKTFRYDTFGDEAFWGDALQLHKAIAGEKHGGVGPGVSRRPRCRSASRSMRTPYRLP